MPESEFLFMTTPALHELADVFDFTEADLAANREGFITERQLKGLRIKRLGMSISLFVEFLFAIGLAAFPVTFLLIALFSPFRSVGNFLLIVPGMLVTGAVAALFFYALITKGKRDWLAYRCDLRDGIVNHVTGQLIKTVTKSRYSKWWTIKICGEELPINQNIFPYFEHGTSYHIYFTPHTRIILSVEFAQDTV